MLYIFTFIFFLVNLLLKNLIRIHSNIFMKFAYLSELLQHGNNGLVLGKNYEYYQECFLHAWKHEVPDTSYSHQICYILKIQNKYWVNEFKRLNSNKKTKKNYLFLYSILTIGWWCWWPKLTKISHTARLQTIGSRR